MRRSVELVGPLNVGRSKTKDLRAAVIQPDAEMYDHCQEIWVIENRAEALYRQLISQYVSTGAADEVIARKAEGCFREIEPLMAQHNSFKLHLFGRLLQLAICSHRNDYILFGDLCRQAIAFFSSKPYDSNTSLQAFYYSLVISKIQLRQFEEGQEILIQYAPIFKAGSLNWVKWQELYLLLAMHTGHFDEAFTLCEQVMRHPGLSKHPLKIQETWEIYKAHTHFLARVGKIDQPPKRVSKLHKFLDETPTLTKHDRIRDIPILIVRILYFLADEKRDAFMDEVKAFDKYNRNHLKKGGTFRTHCFIKMLLKIPATSFHPEALAKKTEKLLVLLQATPLQIANQANEIEIIPYEDLWKIIFGLLSAQQQKQSQLAKKRSISQSTVLRK